MKPKLVEKENMNSTFEGIGFTLVNLKSANNSQLLLQDWRVANKLYLWNSDIVPHNVVTFVKNGNAWTCPLSHIITAPDYDDLEEDVPELYEALKSTVFARQKMIREYIEKSEPIAFDMLAEALDPYKNKWIVMKIHGKGVFGKIHTVSMRQTFFGPILSVTYVLNVWSRGKVVSKTNTVRFMPRDPCNMKEWGFILNPSQEQLDEFLARGRKILDLNQRCGYIQISGNLTYKVSWFDREAPATGRGIVDKTGHDIFNPNNRVDDEYGSISYDEDDDEVSSSDLGDDEIRSLDPKLTVFSFVAKKWGSVHVDQVSEISFREDAFEKLVMPSDDKKLVLSLVRNSDASLVSDLIDNKGGGCVLLLHGKPGLGKTLTAEAVAEVLKRPLYAVSVGELGTDPESLEERLQTVLQTAQRWNAVLLLDEADIFLESRRSGDINRNAMVGTFLRLLEYYNGVLILTTNRVSDMDQAFYSRISLALRYNDFGVETRQQVVKNLLKTNGVSLDSRSIAKISKMDANGRQIKNAIRLARFMSRDESRKVEAKDIIMVLSKLEDFQKTLSS